MKSVFYVLTINKKRYVACVEIGDTVITTHGGYYQRINHGVIKQYNTIGEAIRG